jgi:hypothetical protein
MNVWSCTSTPPYVFMAWCLVIHRDSFTLPCPSCFWDPPILQWVLGFLSLGLKRPQREADCSPPSSSEAKNANTLACIFTTWCSSTVTTLRFQSVLSAYKNMFRILFSAVSLKYILILSKFLAEGDRLLLSPFLEDY